MPLRFTFLEACLARANILPAPLFDMPLTPGLGKTLVVACELRLFDVLDAGALSLNALAEKVNCQPEGLQLLLQLLVAGGYLRHKHELYTNTAVARRWLVSRSRFCVAPYVIHAPDIMEIWDHLPEVVRVDRPAMVMPYVEGTDDAAEAQRLARHYAGLAALATSLGGEIIYRARLLRGATNLLDVGGSHAAYSALYCQRYKHLHATILDLPPGLEAGKLTAKQMALESRMDFVNVDIVKDDFRRCFTTPFDVALYFHVAHLLQPEVNQAVLTRVADVLKPGGMLIYLDQVTDQPRTSHLSSAMIQLMALTMHITGGTCHPFEVVKGWLEQAGLTKVRRHRLLMPGATLITAIKA